MSHQATSETAQPALTFGQKAVGLSFNPSNDPAVDAIKRAYANIIDQLHECWRFNQSFDRGRHLTVAITEAETAQMRAVKALTWKD